MLTTLVVALVGLARALSPTRVAVVTGATKGIGLGIARGLGEAGWRVHITGRTPSGPGSLEAAARAVEAAGGECVAHAVDHADAAAIGALFEAVLAAEPDGVDLLVNNVYPGVDGLGDALRSARTRFWELSPSAFADMSDASLTAHYAASVHYARAMVPRARGLIVMVSSPGGLFYFFTAAYSTGKAALDRLTTDLAHELRGTGVGCVGLYPGLVATEKFEAFAREGLLGMTPESLAADAETPLYSGRAVAALAEDARRGPEQADALSGTIQWTAEVAVRRGITDEHGRQPLSSRALRKVTGLAWLPASWVVPWWVLRFLSPRYPNKPAPPLDQSCDS